MQVKNDSVFGRFYNKFDFVIRFLYCNVPYLHRLFFWKLYSSNVSSLDKNFEELKTLLKKQKFSLKDKVCLELGPGNSYINAYNLLMHGAKKVVLVDKFPRHFRTKRQREYFHREIEYIKKKYNKTDLFFIKEDALDPRYIQFVSGDIRDLDFSGGFDFILSISVLEHVRDVEGTVKALSRALKKSGLMYHSIDLRDHYNFNNPFLFYKYSDHVWNKYLTKEGVSYTNRVRHDTHKNVFTKNDLSIIKDDIHKISIERQQIDRKFAGRSDLDVGIMKVLTKCHMKRI